MKPVVLFNSDLSGGAGSFILTLARALHTRGIETHIVIYRSRIDYPLPEGIGFHLLENDTGNGIEEALKRTLGEIGPVAGVFSNSTPANKILSKIKYPRSYHIVHSAETKHYTGWAAPFKRALRRKKYRHLYSGKDLITVSTGLERYILEELKATPRSIRTLYNPFDFESIRSLADQCGEAIPRTPFLLHVGRLDMTQKRHDILLEAYKKANPAQKLVILGQGEDEEKIRKLIEELELDDRVLMPGFSANPYAWIARADLLILSSDFEGFGRVLVEALALETAVVSTRCPVGPSEILRGDLSDFLVPVGDSDALARQIRRALESYPSLKRIDLSRFDSRTIAETFFHMLHFNEGEMSIQ
ncbi:glycosyltransferase [Nitratifractor sp.]|uniref:glycosyltransferase n=1 Tax=Nitratifractor sp. TaxID=2268144 RepID=UPI0025EB737C|nr:glycosyltransferase [Nitratifractor sp.]